MTAIGAFHSNKKPEHLGKVKGLPVHFIYPMRAILKTISEETKQSISHYLTKMTELHLRKRQIRYIVSVSGKTQFLIDKKYLITMKRRTR